VDDDVECLHVERNPTMTCSGSHLYKFYRYVAVAQRTFDFNDPSTGSGGGQLAYLR
jgi:hypothetical protein